MNTRNRRILLIVAATVLFVVPVAALGATSFWADVPDDNIFVEDTNWMKVTGVSKGCNPPTNTEYCPEDLLTRQEMAAFLHRLSILQVVDAGWLDGRTADEVMSATGAASVDDVDFDPSSGNPINIASLVGFDIPASGGVLTATANVGAEPPTSGTQLGLVWVDIGGNGTCAAPIPNPGGTGTYLVSSGESILRSTSAIATEEIPAGTTRIDLCVSGFSTPPSAESVLAGHLNATWTPNTATAGVAAGQAKTWQEILAPSIDALDG